MPSHRVVDHFQWNAQEYQQMRADVWVVVKTPYEGLPGYVRQLSYPWPMPEFSLTRASNYGLRAACDSNKYTAIMRTDIDICYGGELNAMFTGAENLGRAVVPIYFMTSGYAARHELSHCAYRAEGTVTMQPELWRKSHGYCELLTGYGHDDGEFMARLFELGIPIWRWHRVLHIAHVEGSPQVESFLPEAKDQARSDHWNPSFNPMKINITPQQRGKVLYPKSSGWDDQDWGKIDWSKVTA
jgi:hypothetical protein